MFSVPFFKKIFRSIPFVVVVVVDVFLVLKIIPCVRLLFFFVFFCGGRQFLPAADAAAVVEFQRQRGQRVADARHGVAENGRRRRRRPRSLANLLLLLLLLRQPAEHQQSAHQLPAGQCTLQVIRIEQNLKKKCSTMRAEGIDWNAAVDRGGEAHALGRRLSGAVAAAAHQSRGEVAQKDSPQNQEQGAFRPSLFFFFFCDSRDCRHSRVSSNRLMGRKKKKQTHTHTKKGPETEP